MADSRKSMFGDILDRDRPTRQCRSEGGVEQKMKRAGFPEPLQRITPCSQSSGARQAFAA
jgi:hypothetical protein